MKKLNFLVQIIAFTIFITSCSTTVIEEVVILGPITYTKNVSTIIRNNCLPCHAGTSPSAGLNLKTFAGVQNSTENGNLLARINSLSNPMPSNGKMSDVLINTIEKWATQGYIED